MDHLETIIEQAFENRARGFEDRAAVEAAVQEAIDLLDTGKARVAEKKDGDWHVNQWLKKAVLLSFRLRDNAVIESGHSRFFDKVPMKYADYTDEQFRADGVRVVPDAIVRKGAYVAPDVVLMPSYVNIGAYVDSSTMVDTWATVGSCAQIGKNVHLSGGVGIGGVLEPVHRGRLLHRGAFRGRRGRHRRTGLRPLDGRVRRPEHAHLRPRERRDQLRQNSLRLSRRSRQPAVGRRQLLALLRGHRQARRRKDTRQDRPQRTAQEPRVMLTVFGIKSCDNCRKARKYLAEHDIEFRFHDVRDDGLDIQMLERWSARIDWEKLINRKSLTWRKIPDVDREGMTRERAFLLLLDHPTLLKRPVLEADRFMAVGFSERRFAEYWAKASA